MAVPPQRITTGFPLVTVLFTTEDAVHQPTPLVILKESSRVFLTYLFKVFVAVTKSKVSTKQQQS